GKSRSALLTAGLVCLISIVGFSSLGAGGRRETQRRPVRSFLLERQTLEPQTKTSQAVAPSGDSDEDIPAFAQGLVDHDEYLRLREEHIGRLRGVPYDLGYNARALAIQEMDQQLRSTPTISNSAWSSIGPNPLPVPNGPTVSGRVTAIAIHPANPNTVYVGTAQGGVYRTMDGGVNWTAILDQGASLAIGAVAISPSSPTTIFVGTGEANSSLDCFFGVGVYRIDNADTNPSVAGPFNLDTGGNNVLSGLSVSQLVVSATDPNTIWVSAKFGSSGVGGGFPAFIPNPGVFRSTNAASASVTFSSISVAPIGQFPWEGSDLAFEPGNPANLLCAVQGLNGSGLGGIYRSTNANSASPSFVRQISLPDGTNARLAINK